VNSISSRPVFRSECRQHVKNTAWAFFLCFVFSAAVRAAEPSSKGSASLEIFSYLTGLSGEEISGPNGEVSPSMKQTLQKALADNPWVHDLARDAMTGRKNAAEVRAILDARDQAKLKDAQANESKKASRTGIKKKETTRKETARIKRRTMAAFLDENGSNKPLSIKKLLGLIDTVPAELRPVETAHVLATGHNGLSVTIDTYPLLFLTDGTMSSCATVVPKLADYQAMQKAGNSCKTRPWKRKGNEYLFDKPHGSVTLLNTQFKRGQKVALKLSASESSYVPMLDGSSFGASSAQNQIEMRPDGSIFIGSAVGSYFSGAGVTASATSGKGTLKGKYAVDGNIIAIQFEGEAPQLHYIVMTDDSDGNYNQVYFANKFYYNSH